MALFQRSGMWRDVSPGGAIGDFMTVFRQAGRNRWRIACLALLPPLGIFWSFANEEARGLPPPPVITYITTFRADRSEAEIIASNIANQRYQERLAAEQAKREEEVRQIYEKIGRLSGMDVDAIEAKRQGRTRRRSRRQEAQAAAAGQ